MNRSIFALQKVTLLDYPGKVACTIFSWGCNFRCGFCHNPELVVNEPYDEMIDWPAVISFLKTRTGKLDAVVFCGGEPLLHPEVIEQIREVKKLGFLVKVDTNGSFPERISQLISEKIVDFWSMDIKGAGDEYVKITGVEVNLEDIRKSIKRLMSSNSEYEFRTTFVPTIHTIKSAKGIGELIKGAKNFSVQNFRCGKTVDKRYEKTRSFTNDELQKFKKVMEKYVERVEVKGGK